MKKKGFTLIELLAVIVILAIIALIATPIVMNVIENAKKGAAARSAENYVDAVETAVATARLDGTILEGEYTIQSDGNLCPAGTTCTEDTDIDIDMSGNKPKEGTILIENGQVVDKLSTDATKTTVIKTKDDYNVSYDTNGILVATKGNEENANTPLAVYRWSGENVNIGDTIEPSDYTTNPSTLGKDFYLKHELDQDNKVEASYVCYVFDGEPACIQGGSADYYGYDADPANYTGILSVFKSLENKGINCTIGEYGSSCGNLSADNFGSVSAGGNNESCSINDSGSSCGSV